MVFICWNNPLMIKKFPGILTFITRVGKKKANYVGSTQSSSKTSSICSNTTPFTETGGWDRQIYRICLHNLYQNNRILHSPIFQEDVDSFCGVALRASWIWYQGYCLWVRLSPHLHSPTEPKTKTSRNNQHGIVLRRLKELEIWHENILNTLPAPSTIPHVLFSSYMLHKLAQLS